MAIPSHEEWKRQVAEYERTHAPPERTCPVCGHTSLRWPRLCATCELESQTRIDRALAVAAELHPGRTTGTLEEGLRAFLIAESQIAEEESKRKPV